MAGKLAGVVGLAGVDTRALTKLIREKGMPHAVIAHDPDGTFDLDALVANPGRSNAPAGRDLFNDTTAHTG